MGLFHEILARTGPLNSIYHKSENNNNNLSNTVSSVCNMQFVLVYQKLKKYFHNVIKKLELIIKTEQYSIILCNVKKLSTDYVYPVQDDSILD